MSIFKRSAEVNGKLAEVAEKAGWGSMFLNAVTLGWYFWNKYGKAFWVIRLSGCVAVSGVMLFIEYAALAVLFEPDVLDNFLGQNKKGSELSNGIAGVSMVAVCLLAGATFYYDWVVNLASFNIKTPDMDYQVLAAVSVVISELFFWVANICKISARGTSSGASRSMPPDRTPPAR